MWLVRDYISVCEMKLPSPNQSRVFTRERDKTLKRFCVIKFNPWSFSGYVSPLCIASCSLHSLCEMFLDAARVCNDILTIWLPLPVNKQSPRSPPFPERHTYSRGVFWSASSLFFFSSSAWPQTSAVARVTLCVRLAHPFSTDGTAKSHVVTLFTAAALSLQAETQS